MDVFGNCSLLELFEEFKNLGSKFSKVNFLIPKFPSPILNFDPKGNSNPKLPIFVYFKFFKF